MFLYRIRGASRERKTDDNSVYVIGRQGGRRARDEVQPRVYSGTEKTSGQRGTSAEAKEINGQDQANITIEIP
jgi:hypothetical protein